jgi:hypothetical protein
VLTLKQFDRVMEAFTAEELLHCEIVAQNAEASHIQGNAGRARGAPRLKRSAEEHGLTDDGWQQVPGTIACVSGWLLNMVERRVRLITPCPSSDRWPDGYWVLDDRRFRDGEEFADLLEAMTERHMRATLRAGDPARFRPDLTVTYDDDAIRVRLSDGIVADAESGSFRGDRNEREQAGEQKSSDATRPVWRHGFERILLRSRRCQA